MSAALTALESTSLSRHEETIERGKTAFIEVGLALQAIRDGQLYRINYKTFPDYCIGRWNWDVRNASYYIGAAQVAVEIGTQVPSLEYTQARELSRLANPSPNGDGRKKEIDTATVKEVAASIDFSTATIKDVARAVDKKLAEWRNQSAKSKQGDAPELPTGKYSVIYADPPWQYDFSLSDSRKIENQYQTMTVGDICALPVADIENNDCVLLMWATSPKLIEAMQVIEAWGFTYKTCAVWVKDKIGMGYYFRQQHELLLVASKGNPPIPEPGRRVSSVITAPRLEHSAKPESVYGIIDGMYPDTQKVELFARSNGRKGWTAWGNQLP